MLRLDFERVMIEGAIEISAGAREMMSVARLLFMETCVVGEPLFSRGRANVRVEAVAIFVEGYEAWWNSAWKVRGDVCAIIPRGGSRGRMCLEGSIKYVVGNVNEVTLVTPAAKALIVSGS